MQLARYLEGSPLLWMTLLHLHIYLNAADDDHDDYDVLMMMIVVMMMMMMMI